tara:strand:- start:2867 stop:3172 length:306 start_codon:yes stop_codon:yes gene_type:complete
MYEDSESDDEACLQSLGVVLRRVPPREPGPPRTAKDILDPGWRERPAKPAKPAPLSDKERRRREVAAERVRDRKRHASEEREVDFGGAAEACAELEQMVAE